MPDVLVIVPSREDPARLAEMACAVLGLSELATDVVVAVDDDDPDRPAYLEFLARMPSRCRAYPGPRGSFAGWVNKIAAESAGRYRALAPLGDDCLPRTPGWDRLLLGAIERMGGTGIAFGGTPAGREEPLAPVVSSDIAVALGWLVNPAGGRGCGCETLRAIAAAAGCVASVPQTVIGRRPDRKAPPVPFSASHPGWQAYQAWRAEGMESDVAKVAALRKVPVG